MIVTIHPKFHRYLGGEFARLDTGRKGKRAYLTLFSNGRNIHIKVNNVNGFPSCHIEDLRDCEAYKNGHHVGFAPLEYGYVPKYLYPLIRKALKLRDNFYKSERQVS